MTDNQDYLFEILRGIKQDIQKIEQNQVKHSEHVSSFMSESSRDRALLRQTVESLQTKVDRLAKILGVHKKKGCGRWGLRRLPARLSHLEPLIIKSY